jgi:hypothetical protein
MHLPRVWRAGALLPDMVDGNGTAATSGASLLGVVCLRARCTALRLRQPADPLFKCAAQPSTSLFRGKRARPDATVLQPPVPVPRLVQVCLPARGTRDDVCLRNPDCNSLRAPQMARLWT